jgi:hypothetical protein
VDEQSQTGLEEGLLKTLYERSSRRSAFTKIGTALLRIVGISILPVLPIDRIVSPVLAQSDPCSRWYYCGIYGRLCNCTGCGGGVTTCPSCASMGSFWTGCCQQGSGLTQVSYIDCCSTDSRCAGNCANCKFCTGSGKQEPAWCGSSMYVCTIISVGNGCP